MRRDGQQPDKELSDAELDQISGGWGGSIGAAAYDASIGGSQSQYDGSLELRRRQNRLLNNWLLQQQSAVRRLVR